MVTLKEIKEAKIIDKIEYYHVFIYSDEYLYSIYNTELGQYTVIYDKDGKNATDFYASDNDDNLIYYYNFLSNGLLNE